MQFKPQCLATTIGSLPYTSEREACELVLRHTPAIPAWPQLPRRTFLENMYIQCAELLPGAILGDGKIHVDTVRGAEESLERLYGDYIDHNFGAYLPSPERALGLQAMLERLDGKPPGLVAAKGQVTGPISIGLQVTDQHLRPLLYDEVWAEAVAKHLHLVAAAMEAELAKRCPTTIVFLDEPYLHAYGSALFSVSRDQVVGGLEEVFGGLHGLKGVHCCGNTDWGIVLSTSVDILNLDAYRYAETLPLYPAEVRAFVDRGGIIAWGIVPDDGELLKGETVSSLTTKLLAAMELLVSRGISRERLLAQSLITPSCGLGGQSVETAEKALALLAGVSAEMRNRFFAGREV
ncbi:MAG: methionine synthase [Chloroflexi bacterium]|nr:methionine synthase [Chloroflexota bacterium]